LACLNWSYAAQSNIYLVENIVAEVVGKSPTDARNLAVATARKDAFAVLLTRLELDVKTLASVSDEEISDMVRSEQISDEKIAGNSYSASFNITFAKNFVDHILGQKNPEKLTQQPSENYLLLPVKIVENQPILWEENNDWKNAVAKNLEKIPSKISAQNMVQKFIVPQADIENIAFVNRQNISIASYAQIEPMLAKYKAVAAYSMFFSYDEIENKVTINVFLIRKLQKKQLKLSFVNVDRLGYEALVDKVAAKSVEYLINAQKGEIRDKVSDLIRIQIPINKLANWLAVKNKIENSGLVSQLNVESISRDFALIAVSYNNSSKEIAEAFLEIGLTLEQKSENFYAVSN